MNARVVSLVEQLAEKARRQHYSCEEDTWYNCPAHPDGCADDRQPPGVCNCSANRINAEIEQLKNILLKELSCLSSTKKP